MIPLSHQLNIKLMQRCPSCSQGIPATGIRIIRETERNLFAHVSCPACRACYLTHVMAYPQGLAGNSIVTDLTYDEAIAFFEEKPLDEDFFLELYTNIENNTLLPKMRMHLNH